MHAVAAVFLPINAVSNAGHPKRLASHKPEMKLGVRRKQRMTATDAMIDAICGVVGIFAGKGGFSAFSRQTWELFRAEFLPQSWLASS